MVAWLALPAVLQRVLQLAGVVALVAVALTAQAGPLQGRDINGNPVAANDASAFFEYDPNLNITWLRDWSANGFQNWDTQVAWAAGLTVGTFSGWRLPFIIDTGSPGCDFGYTGTDCGYNVQTASGGTVYSEMAYMWYVELGNLAFFDTSGNAPQPGAGLTNTGPFQNMQADEYWTGTDYPLNPTRAWHINLSDGRQNLIGAFDKDTMLYAVAVRPGDVAADVVAVPEPATLALLGLGFAGLGFSRRKP